MSRLLTTAAGLLAVLVFATASAQPVAVVATQGSGAVQDGTPNSFSFTDQTDVSLSSTITSGAVEISGIDTTISCSATGGTVDVEADADFQSSRNVTNGQDIRARHTSSGSNSTATNTAVNCGGVSDTFTSTTEASGGASDCSDSIYYDAGLDLYFPDTSCVGVLPGIERSSSGSITTSSNGQTIENLNVSGSITVNHNDVTIRNVKITNPGGLAITNFNGGTPVTGTLIENVEMDGTGNSTAASAIDFWNYTLRYSWIHDFGEGPGCAQNVTIEWNLIEDHLDFVSGGAHQDGIQCEFGSNDIIRHNTLLTNLDGANSNIQIGGTATDVVIEYNLFGALDASYNLSLGMTGGRLRYNRFLSAYPAFFGQITLFSVTLDTPACNNVWFDGPNVGQAVGNGGPATC